MAFDLREQGALPDNVAWFADGITTIKARLDSRQSLPTSLSILSLVTLGVATHVDWIPSLPHDQLTHTLVQYALIGCSVGGLAISGAIAQINAMCGRQPDARDMEMSER